MSHPSYLVHMNENHDPKTGQFTFRQGSNIAKEAVKSNEAITNAIDRFGKTKKKPRADLSNLSNKELNDILTREEMEQRYDRYFNTPTEKKGATYAKNILAIAGVAGTLVVSGLTAVSLIMSIQDKIRERKNSAG